jgi:hypothetical protein
MKYDRQFLNEFIIMNDITITTTDFSVKMNRDIRVEGLCKQPGCVNTFNKSFRALVETNGFCTPCCIEFGKAKIKATTLKKYGVEHAMQNKMIQERSKNAVLKKYGVENCFQSETIKAKSRETNLEKYGVEHAMQNKTIREQSKKTVLEKYGVGHVSQSETIKDKKKETHLANYGVEYSFQCPESRAKTSATNMERYGVVNPQQCPEIRAKTAITNIERYGVENCFQSKAIKAKIVATNMVKYGVENCFQSEAIKAKIVATNMIKYGASHRLQNAEMSEKQLHASYKIKHYEMPSGNSIVCQGYEHFAYDDLLNIENVCELDIITKRTEVPLIWYIDETGKKRAHYVDIFIPSQNKCIEVKSTWTFSQPKNHALLKQQSAKDMGHLYEIWIYDPKGIKIQVFT